MRIEEAEWIGRALERFSNAELSPLLEMGSSTLEYRTVQRPYIEALVHQPLRERGIRIVCADIKSGEGIDISGDIYNPEVIQKLKDAGARAMMCSNTLPHVTDPIRFIEICDNVLPPGGLLLISSPQSYPYLVDPIENHFRATPKGLAELLPSYSICMEGSIRSLTFGQELARQGLRGALRTIGKAIAPFHGIERWKARVHRFLWLWRPYRISIVILRKPG